MDGEAAIGLQTTAVLEKQRTSWAELQRGEAIVQDEKREVGKRAVSMMGWEHIMPCACGHDPGSGGTLRRHPTGRT